jgi:hypothetical protein
MSSVNTKLRAGNWVEVKTPEEIAQTLDADGTLDGLPFMPEMIGFCGKRFRVLNQARKACVEVRPQGPFIDMREFHGHTVWVIEGLRCTGVDHDGCQRGCLYYWKSAWLRKVEAGGSVLQVSQVSDGLLRQRLKSKAAPDRYFCQSTELVKATKPLSVRGRLQLCVKDIGSGNVGVAKMIEMIVRPVFWKMVEKFIRPRYVQGALKQTPLIKLDLTRGEIVQIRPAEEIKATLNRKGCNRGLRYDIGLNELCGTRHQVRERLDKIIVESTGQMVQLQGTVTLEDTTCLCYMNALGGCTRQDLVYWREAWLKPIEQTRSGDPKP